MSDLCKSLLERDGCRREGRANGWLDSPAKDAREHAGRGAMKGMTCFSSGNDWTQKAQCLLISVAEGSWRRPKPTLSWCSPLTQTRRSLCSMVCNIWLLCVLSSGPIGLHPCTSDGRRCLQCGPRMDRHNSATHHQDQVLRCWARAAAREVTRSLSR